MKEPVQRTASVWVPVVSGVRAVVRVTWDEEEEEEEEGGNGLGPSMGMCGVGRVSVKMGCGAASSDEEEEKYEISTPGLPEGL